MGNDKNFDKIHREFGNKKIFKQIEFHQVTILIKMYN